MTTNALPDKDTGTFLVLSVNHWGKGDSLAAAKKALKAAGGTLTRYIAYRMPEGTTDLYVDAFGSVRWSWLEGADRTATITEIARRGA